MDAESISTKPQGFPVAAPFPTYTSQSGQCYPDAYPLDYEAITGLVRGQLTGLAKIEISINSSACYMCFYSAKDETIGYAALSERRAPQQTSFSSISLVCSGSTVPLGSTVTAGP